MCSYNWIEIKKYKYAYAKIKAQFIYNLYFTKKQYNYKNHLKKKFIIKFFS